MNVVTYQERQASMKGLSPEERRQSQLLLRNDVSRSVANFSDNWLKGALSTKWRTDAQWLWFWFNHFNVFWRKGIVGPSLADYVDTALNNHVDGTFRALLVAVLTHPAMLAYLDNIKNIKGKINENLARELLELHSLGVNGAYTQADIKNVALILTGFGIKPLKSPSWPSELKPLVVERDSFLFDPRKHDFSDKVVLGRKIKGTGYSEIEALADILAVNPATARHISRKLSMFYWGDMPPEALVEQVAQSYLRSSGDLSIMKHALVGAIGQQPDGHDRSFKPSMNWVLSCTRWVAQGQNPVDVSPVRRWLSELGEPLFGCATPDGFALSGDKWVGSGQLTQRFYVAREMLSLTRRVFGTSFSSDRYEDQLKKSGSSMPSNVRRAIKDAATPELKAALWLSGPVFMYRSPGDVW